jgi:predicted nucleic acid-binding protein
MPAARANCLDASALVKRYVNEEGSDRLRQYLQTESTVYTTWFCYFEALGVLKVKLLYKKPPEMITDAEYHTACSEISAGFFASSINIRDPSFNTPAVFEECRSIAKRHSLDYSDAFQIFSVRKGYFSPLSGESKTILITADKKLADAARREGIRTWNLLTDAAP